MATVALGVCQYTASGLQTSRTTTYKKPPGNIFPLKTPINCKLLKFKNLNHVYEDEHMKKDWMDGESSTYMRIKHYSMQAYEEVNVQIYIFLTSALAVGEWSASRPSCFTPGERVPCIHWIGGWVYPRSGLKVVEKRKFLTPPGLKLRSLGRLARSQSLYRLRYSGSLWERNIFIYNFNHIIWKKKVIWQTWA
jgi:hypothetical protein